MTSTRRLQRSRGARELDRQGDVQLRLGRGQEPGGPVGADLGRRESRARDGLLIEIVSEPLIVGLLVWSSLDLTASSSNEEFVLLHYDARASVERRDGPEALQGVRAPD